MEEGWIEVKFDYLALMLVEFKHALEETWLGLNYLLVTSELLAAWTL